MKIESWNVNGFRSVLNKNFFDYLKSENPDVLCLQEIKVKEEQIRDRIQEIKNFKNHNIIFNSAKRPGYSGTALLTRTEPLSLSFKLGKEEFDDEGRTIIAEFDKFYIVNTYTPNGKRDKSRVPFKMSYNELLLKKLVSLRKKKNVILCGDLNTAHKEIDLARPTSNKNNTGFLPEERAWIDRLVDKRFVDTFRYSNKKPDNYSYWDVKSRARERNVGWRIDYFFVNSEFLPKIKRAYISKSILGSDHCPVGVEID